MDGFQGQSQKLGSWRYGIWLLLEEHVFLGRELTQQRDFSEHTARLIDEAIRRLLVGVQKEGQALLQGHRAELDALADALVEAETLEASDVQRLVKGVEANERMASSMA